MFAAPRRCKRAPSALPNPSHPAAPPAAACDYATVERVNCRSVHPLLAELVAQPFFRYFKVNLYCDCPFWPDDGMCMLRDCSVCECDESEVPALWLAQDRPAAADAAASAACQGTPLG